MIIIRVELHSAITRRVTEIARMRICNIGGTRTRGSYSVQTLHGRCKEQLDKMRVRRQGSVSDYPRTSVHVWHLVARALIAMKYAGANELEQPTDLLDAIGESEIAP